MPNRISISVYIKTPNFTPIAKRSRCYNPDREKTEDRTLTQENVDKLLEEGIIHPSSSPWRSQILIAKDENF